MVLWELHTHTHKLCSRSDRLKVRSENTVFQAIKRWWWLSPHSPFSMVLVYAKAMGMSHWPPLQPQPAPSFIKALKPRKKEQRPGIDFSSVAATGAVVEFKLDKTAPMQLEDIKTNVLMTAADCERYARTALTLISAVRFTNMSPDFLHDVVRHDETFAPRHPLAVTTTPIAQRVKMAVTQAIEFEQYKDYLPSTSPSRDHEAKDALLFSASRHVRNLFDQVRYVHLVVMESNAIVVQLFHEAVNCHSLSAARKTYGPLARAYLQPRMTSQDKKEQEDKNATIAWTVCTFPFGEREVSHVRFADP